MNPYESHTDQTVLLAMQDGEQVAFAELYNRYHQLAYGYVFTQVKIPTITQDILHDVFLKLWEDRSKISIQHQFKSYLLRSCHNKVVDFYRQLAKDRQLQESLLYQYEQELEHSPNSKQELLKLDALAEEALSTLSPQRRKVFELCRRQGKTYNQVADELGISPQTVKEHMANALSSLRRFLHKRTDLVTLLLLLKKYFE